MVSVYFSTHTTSGPTALENAVSQGPSPLFQGNQRPGVECGNEHILPCLPVAHILSRRPRRIYSPSCPLTQLSKRKRDLVPAQHSLADQPRLPSQGWTVGVCSKARPVPGAMRQGLLGTSHELFFLLNLPLAWLTSGCSSDDRGWHGASMLRLLVLLSDISCLLLCLSVLLYVFSSFVSGLPSHFPSHARDCLLAGWGVTSTAASHSILPTG